MDSLFDYDNEFAEKFFAHPDYEKSNELFVEISKKMKTFHHHPHILYVLRDMLGPDHKVYMEIGSFFGASASLMMSSSHPTTILACDTFDLSTYHQTEFMNNTFHYYQPIHKIHPLKGNSQSKEMADKVTKLLDGRKIDLFFIDGDHRYRPVVHDFLNYHKHISNGGYVVFDDYQDHIYSPDVKKAVHWICRLFAPWYNIIGSLPNKVQASAGKNAEYNEKTGTYSKSIPNPMLDKFSNEFIIQKKEEDIHINFAIIMATYYRKNGTTLAKIKRAIKSVQDQTYQHWTLILVGDKYENEEEFKEIVDLVGDSDKIIYKNLDHAYERELHEAGKIDVRQLWNNAGASAMQSGIDLARENGFTHVAHLDDDDFWEPNHLEELNKAYLDFPETIFVNTCGKFLHTIIPNNQSLKREYNMFFPRGKSLLHSAASWRIDFIELPYPKINFEDKDNDKVLNTPADALMWDRMRAYMNQRQYASVYVPKLTVNHLEEGADYF